MTVLGHWTLALKNDEVERVLVVFGCEFCHAKLLVDRILSVFGDHDLHTVFIWIILLHSASSDAKVMNCGLFDLADTTDIYSAFPLLLLGHVV